MVMQKRQYTSSTYRFGYQGSEKESGVGAGGFGGWQYYTTENRMLDSRLGRWFTPDPITHPWQSSYVAMDNNPIAITDILGLDGDPCGGSAPITSDVDISGGQQSVNASAPSSSDGGGTGGGGTSGIFNFGGQGNFGPSQSANLVSQASDQNPAVVNSSRATNMGDVANTNKPTTKNSNNTRHNVKVDQSKYDWTLTLSDDPYGMRRNMPGWGVIKPVDPLKAKVNNTVGTNNPSVLIKIGFLSQYDKENVPEAGDKACFRACVQMLKNSGIENKGAGAQIKMCTDGNAGDEGVLPDAGKAIEKINENLNVGKPVILGVNYKSGSENPDKTTDHYVVIIGRGNDAKGAYYTFFDPGVFNNEFGKSSGSASGNKLYLNGNLLRGNSVYRNQKGKPQYTSSWLILK